MAGGVEPQRALPLPHRQRIRRFAGAPALEAGAAWAVVLARGGAEIGTETETFVRQRDRPVRIALAGRDAVAETGHENVAYPDLGRDPLRCVRPAGDIDRGGGLAT